MARLLTEWVVRNAVRQAALWKQKGIGIKVSINVTASNLEEKDFARRLIKTVTEHHLECSDIEVELTESALISNRHSARIQLHQLIVAGFEIAIDDFGTGYSSLAYLKDIPARVVKIDGTFIQGLEQDSRRQLLVKAMISMARDLGYRRVVAEGVETGAAYQALLNMGCDEVQGYWLSRPLQAQPFQDWACSGLIIELITTGALEN